ncbi:uncharacterized protein VTP21DRAFT_1438 [Calcarisporiella thermophila]|uniref:uncharacterized protein n=1 Tax=Calcarisporiella thermophila TaxID=911321 RepID=UPI003741F2B5
MKRSANPSASTRSRLPPPSNRIARTTRTNGARSANADTTLQFDPSESNTTTFLQPRRLRGPNSTMISGNSTSILRPSSRSGGTINNLTSTANSEITRSIATNPLQIKKEEKLKELNNLLLLRGMSEKMVGYFEEIGRGMSELSEGCEAVAQVLNNWQNVFRTISLASQGPKDDLNGERPPTLVQIPMGEY